MEEGLYINELVKKLCQSDKEAIWATGMNKQNLNLNARALQPKWAPLFKLICSRSPRIPPTSLWTGPLMIEKRKVDVGWIIFNNIIDSVKP